MSSPALTPTSKLLLTVPWLGLLMGWAIVAIAALVPPVVTFAVVWMIIFVAAPIALIAQMFGAGVHSATVGFGSLLILHLLLFNVPLVAGLIRRERIAIAVGLNASIVGWALLWGLWIAVQAMGEAWPG